MKRKGSELCCRFQYNEKKQREVRVVLCTMELMAVSGE